MDEILYRYRKYDIEYNRGLGIIIINKPMYYIYKTLVPIRYKIQKLRYNNKDSTYSIIGGLKWHYFQT